MFLQHPTQAKSTQNKLSPDTTTGLQSHEDTPPEQPNSGQYAAWVKNHTNSTTSNLHQAETRVNNVFTTKIIKETVNATRRKVGRIKRNHLPILEQTTYSALPNGPFHSQMAPGRHNTCNICRHPAYMMINDFIYYT